MTCELALAYLDLPSIVSMADTVQLLRDELRDAAKKFLVDLFKDLSECHKELLTMPLAGIEAVLGSDYLIMCSEDEVYDFVLEWAQLHFPNMEERREMLSNHLLRFVRFPHMTDRKLRQVLTCNEIESGVASKVVLDALSFKAKCPRQQRSLMAEDANASYPRLVKRSYTLHPVKMVEFKLPYRQSIVYLDITRGECEEMLPDDKIFTQSFYLGEQEFYLFARCNENDPNSSHGFGLFLGMEEEDGSVGLTLDCEFAARKKPSKKFVTIANWEQPFIGGEAIGWDNLFKMWWTEFMAEDSPYLIDGVLHLRVEITIKE